MKKLISVVAILAIVVTGAFALAACNGGADETGKTSLRFVVPDGTPALAAMNFLGESVEIGKYSVTGSIVSSTSIQTEMGGEKADVLIAPTNAGASLIKNGAAYKLAAVAVEGSLYVIGKPENAGGDNVITFDELKGKKIASIGQNNTPDKVFKYVVEHTDGINYSDFTVEFVADGPAALVALSRDSSPCDFAIVGEPAATAFGTAAKGGYSARLDIQAAYKAVNGNDSNFPQASLFVKSELFADGLFMSELYNKLDENKAWVSANAADVTTAIQAKGSTSAFPAPSIPRCAITVTKTDAGYVQTAIISYLTLMVPGVEWATVPLFV